MDAAGKAGGFVKALTTHPSDPWYACCLQGWRYAFTLPMYPTSWAWILLAENNSYKTNVAKFYIIIYVDLEENVIQYKNRMFQNVPRI